jgi:hypothetical protein
MAFAQQEGNRRPCPKDRPSEVHSSQGPHPKIELPDGGRWIMPEKPLGETPATHALIREPNHFTGESSKAARRAKPKKQRYVNRPGPSRR